MVKPCPRILHNVWHLFSASALLGSCTPSCQTSNTIQKVKSSQIPHPQPLLSISQIHSKRLQAAVYPWSKEKYRLKCKEWHQQAVINVMYHGHTTRTSPSYHRDITKTQPTFCEDTAKTLNWNQVTGALVTSRPVSASVPRQNRKCSKQQASLFPKGVSKNLGKPCSLKKDWYTKLKQTNKLRSRALGRNESQRNQIWTFTRPERNTPFLGHVGAMLGLCGTYVGSIMLTARTKAQKQRSNPVIVWDQSERLRNMTSNRQEYEPIFSLIGGQSKMQAVPEDAGVARLRHCYIPMRLSKEAWESILPLNWCLQLKQRDVSKKG